MTSPLWGAWMVEKPSGDIVIVTLADERVSRPWLYVWADESTDDARFARCRELMANEICQFLSGTGDRPTWLNDFETVESDCLVSLSGAQLLAIGPLLLTGGLYTNDETAAGKEMRAALIKHLVSQ